MTIDEILRLADQYEHALPPMPELPAAAALERLIDHTILKADALPIQVERLCEEARAHHFAAVCVNSVYVPLTARLLAGSDTAVCTVVGFPLGASLTAAKVAETHAAAEAGAVEIDMVIPVGLLKGEEYAAVLEDIRAVVAAAHAHGALVKVILENCYLNRREKIIACLLCKEAGAEFVKTSTGFGPTGATAEDVQLMRRVVGAKLGVKAAGGVRSLADARAMLAAGATRLGTSSGVRLIQERDEAQ